jgi:hypothetical protein
VPHQVVPAIVHDNPNKDDVRNGAGKIDAFRSLIRTGIRRGGNAVAGWPIAFRRTARLQWARMTLNPFQLNAADLDGLDNLYGSRLRKVARSEIAQLIPTGLSAH